MHVKFEIEIPKQTSVTLRKPYRLEKDGRGYKNFSRYVFFINTILETHF